MKKILWVFVALFFTILAIALCKIALAGYADFDADFANASQMRTQMGQEVPVQSTDMLIKGTTGVIHRENMAILAEIDKLHKEIANLKKDIKEVKDTVEGGM